MPKILYSLISVLLVTNNVRICSSLFGLWLFLAVLPIDQPDGRALAMQVKEHVPMDIIKKE